MANRPTLRAFEQTYETALGAGKLELASEILAAAEKRWGTANAFGLSENLLTQLELEKGKQQLM